MYSTERITIAIDGYSSCGKSTLAKALSERLGYIFIDTGAMYRAVTLYAMRKGFILDKGLDKEALINELDAVNLRFELNSITGKPEILLNEENVEEAIRRPEVSANVSKVAAIREVRQKLVSQQRLMGLEGGVVMDGRDIGSVVFPHAELKLFVTADTEVRTKRRFLELRSKGIETSMEAVRSNLIERDHIDSTREESPLVQAADAIVLDNSNLTPDEQLEYSLNLVSKIIEATV